MKILSIETSCDETAISILDIDGGFTKPKVKILADQTLSQVELHAQYGGVFPSLAKREHAKNLIPILKNVLKESDLKKENLKNKTITSKELIFLEKTFEREPELLKQFLEFIKKNGVPEIDAIAVTYGPGLAPALWVGLNFTKALSFIWDKPMIPVNHMEGHIMAALLETTKDVDGFYKLSKVNFPSIALLISGGHTELVLMSTQGKPSSGWKYETIGQTRDDAVGEAFDKVARMLGLPYPGGPEISKMAALGSEASKWKLPRPMINSGDLDFSFSGLKTAVLYMLKKIPKLTKQIKADVAKEFEEAVVEILIKKTMKALEESGARTLIIGGGVSANQKIRQEFKKIIGKQNSQIKLFIPNHKLSTDNALMIGLAAYFRALKNTPSKKHQDLQADGNLKLGK